MHSAVAAETDRLAARLNILATVGSVAPFVGLFGTVWGIMRSFTDIAGAQNTSLAVVAPGIAEALFATALGLFAAIPAVIAYNRFSYGINRIEARLQRFADGFHGTLVARAGGGGLRMAMGPILGAGRRGRRTPMAEINVTPMVDVMLVLLIIFMVTAPLLAAGVQVDLPESKAAALEQNSEPVTISIDRAGAIFSTTRRCRPSALGAAAAADRGARAASTAGRASSCAPTAASITAG